MHRARRHTDVARRIEDAFAPPVIEEGRRYHAQGRVALEPQGPVVKAAVRGSAARLYETVLSAPGQEAVRMRCTCDEGQKLEPCKHMWAVVLASERLGVAPEVTGRGLLDLVLETDTDEELFPAPPGWSPEAGKHGPPPGGRARRRVRGSVDWRTRLETFAADADDAPHVTTPLDYVAHLRGALPGEVTLQPMRRSLGADGGPGPLRELDDPDLPVTSEDEEILTLLGYDREGRRSRSSPGGLVLRRIARAGRLYRASMDGDPLPLRWMGDEPHRLALTLVADEGGEVRAEWWLRREDERRLLRECRAVAGTVALFGSEAVALDEAPPDRLWPLVHEGALRAPRSDVDDFVAQLAATPSLPPLELDAGVGWATARVPPVPWLRLGFPDEKDDSDAVTVDLSFRYEGEEVPLGDRRAGLVDEAARRVIPRDRAAERAAWARLSNHGTVPKGDDRRGLIPRASVPALAEALLADGWRVEAQGQSLRSLSSMAMSVSSGIDWFDLSVEASFDGATLALDGVLAALRRGERFIALGDGSMGLLPEEWLARFQPLAHAGSVEGDKLRFRRSQAIVLDALLALTPQVDVDANFARLRDELYAFEGLEPESPPPRFAGELRPYQRLGLSWLHFLERVGFGGCLADDMGLGKTVQVLALLAGRPEGSPPSLVVAPKSLVANWNDEREHFTPWLRALDYTGPERHGADLNAYDLVLTTYGTLRRDIERLREQRFDYIVLDEAQAIKNPRSQVAKASRVLRADHRLALTGTPIENSLADLASIFEFINPGMIGGVEALRALASVDGPEEVDLLRRALRPFLLRRTKAAVLPDLPEKSEQTLHCRLEGRQRKLYDELRAHYRASLKKRIDSEGLSRSKIHVLEALLRLRQAACHAGMLDATMRHAPSAKLRVLVENLLEITAGGHKALVFSQFTSFLDIVRPRLERVGIPFAYLDGSTTARNRAAAVERFQTDPDCLAFLISLKAGGTGLNLTAADYVFLLDPWWNPAVETQAIDRTHRIGQTRPVFAYRLIAEDTIEEKVLALQQSKRDLARGLLSEDESLLRTLTADDLAALLA